MARRYGRAPHGERLRTAVPHGHWMTTTFVGGLRLSGMTAPLVIDGPMAGAWFEACVARALAPTLKRGDVVILDNLPAQKRRGAGCDRGKAHGCSSFRYTRQTSIQSKTPSLS